jgi:hypothetical protein
VALIAALLVASLAMTFFRKSNASKAAEGPPPAKPIFHESSSTQPARLHVADPTRPEITRVTVEKRDVCRGEENAIDVVAHDVDGRDEHLRISFDDPSSGRTVWGSRIPFRLNQPLTRPMRVAVQGHQGVASVEVPHVNVKDCVAAHQVVIELQRTADAADRVKLKAQLIEPPASDGTSPPALIPVAYRWDFGDGHQETTTGPDAEHSYEGREQNVALASFVASVRLEDRSGNTATGSRAIAFPNAGFTQLSIEGRVLISAGFQDVQVNDVGPAAAERVWLYHGYRRAVRIDNVRLRETVLDGDQERETMSRDYDPDALLGFRELPPGQSVTTRDLTAIYPSAKDATAVRYLEVRGRSADGKEASGTFTLLSTSTRVARRSPSLTHGGP